MKLGENYYNAISDTADLHTAIISSTTLGIAIPMESGQFKVVRFSLNGANTAIRAAANTAATYEKASDHFQ
jgi:hypothetical protein